MSQRRGAAGVGPRRRAEDSVSDEADEPTDEADELSDEADEATDETLRALAEPRRRAILRLVASDELAAGEIAAAFDVSRTAISQHLTVLKNAGLLAERREGTRRLYRARPEGLAGLRQFLDQMWASSLDTARRLVESERGITDGDQAASTG
jgi:DNA-binding transcriptional ArsR family regulator